MSDPLRQMVFKLGASLAEAAKHDDEGNAPQVRASLALDAVNTFLREVGFKMELRSSLLKLQAALVDHGEGRNNTMLERATPNGNPGRAALDRERKPLAAALATLYAEENAVSLRSAAGHVGERFGIEGLPDYLGNLRSKSKGKHKLSADDRARYWEWLKEFREGDIQNTISDLVDHLANKA